MANRWLFLIVALGLASAICTAQAPTSDPQALALVAKSVAAMTGGQPVSGVTLNAKAIWVAGSNYFTGTATLQGKGTTDSLVTLNLNGFTRTENRTQSGGIPSGTWSEASATPQPLPLHNCWSDAVWFFPALSSLTQAVVDTNFFFSYVGQEQHGGVSTQHIRWFQLLQNDRSNVLQVQRLSTSDVYLDSSSFLPVAVAFEAHPDKDMTRDVPMEIGFANYQVVNGVQVPFHIQRMLNGSVILDLTVTNAVMNSAVSLSQAQ